MKIHSRLGVSIPLQIFISYSTIEKQIAGALKRHLEYYGFDVFLSHEDIAPGFEWVFEIENHLKACDIFIPIISPSFKESDWTDQECGIAYASGSLIIPVKLTPESNPYGFIHKFQALQLKNKYQHPNNPIPDYFDCSSRIVERIRKEEQFSGLFRSSVINGLLISNSYDSTRVKIKIIEKMVGLTKDELLSIFNAGLINDQVYNEVKAGAFIKRLLDENPTVLTSEKKKLLLDLIP